MANGIPRRRSIFTGTVLILLGLIFLAQNFRGDFGFFTLFGRWWPLILILWGITKLYDRLAAQRSGEGAPPTITGGEILLVTCLVFVGLAISLRHRVSREIRTHVHLGHDYSF